MIKFENTEVVGWEAAIRGMRNPMNSWKKSDSYELNIDPIKNDIPHVKSTYQIGPNDLALMEKLRNAGTDHRKFMRMIEVYVDITAPLYWWKEFDTYKVGTVANSCSTMHKIADKEFELDDFSHEHLGVHISPELNDGEECYQNLWEVEFTHVIECLNVARRFYINEKNPDLKKQYWWQMIQLLPSSYNQKRTIMMSYEVLANIYKSRKDHKLDEWAKHNNEDPIISEKIAEGVTEYSFNPNYYFGFCAWIKRLPYSELITGEDYD